METLTQTHFQKLLKDCEAFLFDCDGVLWRGDTAILNSDKAVEVLRQRGKRVLFVTNNSTKSRDTYVKKLASIGITAKAEDVVSSASATAMYMQQQKFTKKIMVIGEAGLLTELDACGFSIISFKNDEEAKRAMNAGIDPEIQAVVMGLDRDISYYKLAYANSCIREIQGCSFIATNMDATFPSEKYQLPGTGAWIQALIAACGRDPDIVIGKPSQALLQTMLVQFNLKASTTCMIGDRLSTDIAFGKQGGLQTILVLSGVTALEDLGQLNPILDVVPHYVTTTIEEFVNFAG